MMPWERDDWGAKYKLDGKELGRGGWGIVVPVVHLESGERRALKYPLGDDLEIRARFKREISVQKKLEHRHVMRIVDSDPEFGWFAMPLAGRTLRNAAPELSDDDVASLTVQVANGLHDAHHYGFIHRDVKPSNILQYEEDGGSDQPDWVIADFGLVHRPKGQGTDLNTKPGTGTDGFIAPEVALDHGEISPAADVYSLGRTLAWLTTGTMPEGFKPLDAPGLWTMLVAQMTAFEPNRRLQTMIDVIVGIRRVQGELRALRTKLWGNKRNSQISTDDEDVLLAVIDNPMDPEDENSDLAASYGRLTSIFPSTGLLNFSLRRLVERGYLRQGVYVYTDRDGPNMRTYIPTPHAWRWLEDNLERVRARLLPKEKPAEPSVAPVLDDDIPF